MLLTDSRAAVPVLNQRTHENLIVTGTGNDATLQVLSVSSASDIKVGDVLLSSGMGGHYPVGYPVGVVQQVISKDGAASKIFVKPAASLNQLQLVLIVFLDNGGDDQ
jgi:rod shape-determining protein MreC